MLDSMSVALSTWRWMDFLPNVVTKLFANVIEELCISVCVSIIRFVCVYRDLIHAH